MIVSRTPLRISLIGGSTDVPAFYEKHPGVCVSFAINKYVYIAVNDKFDGRYRVSYSRTENVEKISDIKHSLVKKVLTAYDGSPEIHNFRNGLEVVSVADIPGEGTGLGSSSSFVVGLTNAIRAKLNYVDMSKVDLADHAFQMEQQINPHIGKQDHFAAAFGGFNFYAFNKDDTDWIIPVRSMWDSEFPWSWNELHSHMLLLWTGITRKSDDLLKSQKEGFDSGKTLDIGKELVFHAHEFHRYLVDGKIQRAAQVMLGGWLLKRELAPGITNEWINNWIEAAMNNGAWGGKLLGAGGGGFLFFFAPPDTHDRIVKATGLRKIDFNIDHEGSVIIKREGYGSF